MGDYPLTASKILCLCYNKENVTDKKYKQAHGYLRMGEYNMRMKNTKKHGQVSFLILQNAKDKSYLGICYEFALVLESDDEDELIKDLREAVEGYVKTVDEKKLPNYLLNKSDLLPKEYKELYDEFKSRFLLNRSTTRLSNDYEDALQNGRAQLTLACV